MKRHHDHATDVCIFPAAFRSILILQNKRIGIPVKIHGTQEHERHIGGKQNGFHRHRDLINVVGDGGRHLRQTAEQGDEGGMVHHFSRAAAHISVHTRHDEKQDDEADGGNGKIISPRQDQF